MTAEVVVVARQRVDRIKARVGAARADVIESYRQRDWIALGYESWDALCLAEYGTVLPLSIEDRQQAGAEMAGEGMSTRAIGSALGVDHATVVRDMARGASAPRASVTCLDGKTYRRITDPRLSAEVTAQIIAMHESGEHLTWAEIGESVGLNAHATKSRYIKYQKKHPNGQPVVTQLPTPQKIADLAGTGKTGRQIAADIGISVERVRQLARREGITIVGDANRPKGAGKTIDQNDAVGRWITQLGAALDAADAFLDPDAITTDQAAEWVHQLDAVIQRLRGLTRALRDNSQGRQTHHGGA